MDKDSLSPSSFIGVRDEGIISFGSGQPDLPPPKAVFDILPKYSSFKYGLVQGQVNLRQELTKQYPKSTEDSFVITNGASEALDLSLRVIARRNDKRKKILLPQPYYYSYPHLVNYAGLEPQFTKLNKGRIDFDDFEKKVHDCRAVIINSPSNPTGRVEDIKTLKKIEKITQDLDVYVLSDEVYKDLIYTRENYLIQGPHVVTINSFSKTFSMCGFRVGYLWTSDQQFVDEVIAIKTHSSMNTNILGQEMAYEAMKVPRKFVDEQLKIWEHRRDLIYDGLVNLGLELWRPEGAFYVLPKISNPRDFVWDMYKQHKVITYLGEWFGAPDRVRFSYALDADKIGEGLGRVKKYLEGR